MRQRAENNSQFRDIRKSAVAQGWLVEKTKKNHWKFTPPKASHSPVFFSGSPGEWRALANFIAALRQRGFQPPSKLRKGKKK